MDGVMLRIVTEVSFGLILYLVQENTIHVLSAVLQAHKCVTIASRS